MREGLVSLVLSKDDVQSILEWELVSERTIRARSTQGGSRSRSNSVMPLQTMQRKRQSTTFMKCCRQCLSRGYAEIIRL